MTHTTDRHHPPAGFALITVLVAVSVITGLVAAYGRHVVVEGRSSLVATPLLESREACHSGVRLARQCLVSGAGLPAGPVASGSCSADITVTTLPGGNQSVQVESVGQDGFGARRSLELGLIPAAGSTPAAPADLPTLDGPTISGLAADPYLPVTHFTSSTTLSHTELVGLGVVHPGVEVVLDDVVVTGAFVSSKVMSQTDLGDYDASTAPRVVIGGNVRIDPHPSLSGVAVLLPDGALTSAQTDARVQIHGDVVAHDVSLLHQGVVSGNVSAVSAQLADHDLDRLGQDRKGAEWSSELALGGAQQPLFLAAVPPSTTAGALSSIINYWEND